MRRTRFLPLLIVCFLAAATASPVRSQTRAAPVAANSFVERRLHVYVELPKTVPPALAGNVEAIRDRLALRLHERIDARLLRTFITGWQLVELPPGLGVRDAMERYRLRFESVRDNFLETHPLPPDVKQFIKSVALRVEPDYRMVLPAAGPSRPFAPQPGPAPGPGAGRDPDFGAQEHLQVIKAPQAWALSRGSRQVVVAVLDGSMDENHPDLRDNMAVVGSRFDACAGGVHSADREAHGTQAAGVIGAVGGNDVGIVGVNWYVSLLNVPILCDEIDSQGRPVATVSKMEEAYEYLIKLKKSGTNVRVINNSWCNERPNDDSDAQRAIIDRAGECGILSVFAAGNLKRNNDDRATRTYPASYPCKSIVSVLETDLHDRKTYSSCWGLNSVHIAAPGQGVLTTCLGGESCWPSGTSFAAPLVSGAAALLVSCEPDIGVDELKKRIMESGDFCPSLVGYVIGAKRLNVFRLLAGDAAVPPGR